MKTLHFGFMFLVLGLLAGAVDAQAPARVRGTISAADGGSITVKSSDGKNVAIQLADKTAIVFTQPITLADIKPGDFLGVTSTKRVPASTSRRASRQPRPKRPVSYFA